MATIYELPRAQWRVSQSQFDLQWLSLSSTSLLGGDTTPYSTDVARWTATLTFSAKGPYADTVGKIDRGGWREMSAFRSRLRGMSGLLRLPDFSRLRPAYNELHGPGGEELFSDGTGFTDGTGLVSGLLPPQVAIAEAVVIGAESILLSGFPVSLSAVLAPGDLIEALPSGQRSNFGHLYEVTAQANSDASGMTRVSIAPPARAALAAGDGMRIEEAMTVFRLVDDGQGSITRNVHSHGQQGLSLVEVLPPLS